MMANDQCGRCTFWSQLPQKTQARSTEFSILGEQHACISHLFNFTQNNRHNKSDSLNLFQGYATFHHGGPRTSHDVLES